MSVRDLSAESLLGGGVQASPVFLSARDGKWRYLFRPYRGRVRYYWDRTMTALANGLVVDRYLDAVASVAETVDGSYRKFRRSLEAARPERSLIPGGNMVGTGDVILAVRRLAAALASRRLVRLGVRLQLAALETGRYPRTLEGLDGAHKLDPLTGAHLVYEVTEVRSARLLAPGAREVWAEHTTHLAGLELPLDLTLTRHESRPQASGRSEALYPRPDQSAAFDLEAR